MGETERLSGMGKWGNGLGDQKICGSPFLGSVTGGCQVAGIV